MEMVNGKNHGKMLAICSAAGGVGRTVITVNLAAMLAKRKIRVGIMDADLQFGDIALALNLEPVTTIKEAVERDDLRNVRDYCLSHDSGIQLLAAPKRPEYADLITVESLESAADALLSEAELLLVETQPGLNDHNLFLMEKADHIVLVTTVGMASLKNTKLMVETLDALGLKDKLVLVVNQSTSSSIIKAGDIPKLTQMEQVFYLPSEMKRMDYSLDAGIPLATSHPKLAFSKDMEKLASHLFPKEHHLKAKGFSSKIGPKTSRWRGKMNEFIGKNPIEEPK